MRRNAATGALEKSGSALIAGWSLADLPSPQFFLGHSQYHPVNYDANAEYDEVRIWHGVVSDADLDASAALGPDVKLDSWDVVLKPENLEKLKSCGVSFLDAPEEIFATVLKLRTVTWFCI